MNRASVLMLFFTLTRFELILGNANKSDVNGPSVALTRQAIELGMEPAAFGELWRTKQPVVINKTDAQGRLCITTFEFNRGNQSISKSTVVSENPNTIAASRPPNSSPEMQPGSLDPNSSPNIQPKSSAPTSTSEFKPTDQQTEWEYISAPSGSRRTYTLSSTTTSEGNVPNFGISFPHSTNWNVLSDWSRFGFPAAVQPQSWTQSVFKHEDRAMTTPIFKGPGLPVNWTSNISNDSLSNWFKQPLDSSPNIPSSTPTAAWPLPAAGTQLTLRPMYPPLPTPASKSILENMDVAKRTTSSNPIPNDLPTHRGSQQIPTYLDDPPAQFSRRVTSYTTYGSSPPNSVDFDMSLQQLLNRGGITDEDIRQAREQGGYLTRTGLMPNGQVFKTTVQINNSPGSPPLPLLSTHPTSADRAQIPSHQQSSIGNFLSQVRLTPAQITDQNRVLFNNLVDGYGRAQRA